MSALPPGWSRARFGDLLADILDFRGRTPKKLGMNWGGTIPALSALNVRQGHIDLSRTSNFGSDELYDSWMTTGDPARGDIVLTMEAPLGNVAQIPDDRRYILSQRVVLLKARHGIDPAFLAHQMRAPQLREQLLANATGTTATGISQARLLELEATVAPFIEQKRVADKLDALLARIDACRARLDRVPAILKRFRQAVLDEALTGELTAEWRSAGIERWTSLRAADVCAKVQSGGTPKEGFTDSGVPFLKVYNIVGQRVSFDYKPQFIAAEVHKGSMSKSIVRPGDVLMNIVGPPLGKIAIVPDTYAEWNMNQAITLFRPSEQISSKWLYYVLCSGQNIAEIVHETRGSAGQVNISLSQCRDFVFPVPPRDEQTEIVRRVESLFALADALQAKYESARAQIERVTPAILAKAFRGELVPQDPNDEPASALLERLKFSEAASTSGRRTRKAATSPSIGLGSRAEQRSL